MRLVQVLPIVCVAHAALFSGLCSAQPQPVDNDYTVEHNFSFQPSGDVVEVLGADFRHAWIQTSGIYGDAWSVEATGQNPGFDPFGTESFASGASGFPVAFNSGIGGSPVQCNYNIFNIPPAGINDFACIILPLGQSFADACTEFVVAPYSTTPPFNIHGVVRSSGGVHAINAGCYAYSSAGVSVRGGIDMGNGMVQWNPVLTDTVGGGASAVSTSQDPVYMVANNLDTGVQIRASFFDYSLTASGPGMVNWDNGAFETDHKDLEFRLEIPAAYVAPGQSGSMHLLIEHGIITVSDDDGAFDGLLPPAGEATPIVFPLPNNFQIDYDLNLDPIFNWDVTADLSGAGGAQAANTCRADLNGDGVLNFFDVSTFINLYTSGDPGADFNGDKELNFFDISEFIAEYADGCDTK